MEATLLGVEVEGAGSIPSAEGLATLGTQESRVQNGRLVAQNGFWMDIGGNASRSESRRACNCYVAPDYENVNWD